MKSHPILRISVSVRNLPGQEFAEKVHVVTLRFTGGVQQRPWAIYLRR
jgi:hypothetical protein